MEPIPSELVVRKRKFVQTLNEDSAAESRHELELLKKRDISPRTMKFVDAMIDSFDEMNVFERWEEGWQKKSMELARLETMLDDRLRQEAKYYDIRVEFQLLVTRNLIMRYGDYYKGNLHALKEISRERAKKDKKVDILAGMTWKEISKTLAKEMVAYNEWWKKKLAYINNNPRPSTPIKDEIEIIAELVCMPETDAHFQIEQYATRCNIAHSGIDEAIAGKMWIEVANYIIRDRTAIENGILPHDMAKNKEKMLEALKIFEKRYFSAIITGTDPQTGILVAFDYTRSDELLKKIEGEKKMELKKELQAQRLRSFEETIEEAKNLEETEDRDLIKARDELIEAEAAVDLAKIRLKLAQAKLGISEIELKERAAKYRNLKEMKAEEEEMEGAGL